MSKAAQILRDSIRDSEIIENKRDTDTIRLWENYREQAILWRALALLQIPTVLVALVFAVILWNNRKITLNVPAKPLPGTYSANEIPDAEFINVATSFINLIATYQQATAKRQFVRAREYLVEPMLTTFERDMLGTELKAISSTNRTQIFFVDPTKTQLKRDGSFVRVLLVGDRLKLVAGKQLPSVTTSFLVTLGVIPRNDLNPYGIVITNIDYANKD